MAVTNSTVASTMLYQSLFNILLSWHDVQCHIYSFYHIHTGQAKSSKLLKKIRIWSSSYHMFWLLFTLIIVPHPSCHHAFCYSIFKLVCIYACVLRQHTLLLLQSSRGGHVIAITYCLLCFRIQVCDHNSALNSAESPMMLRWSLGPWPPQLRAPGGIFVPGFHQANNKHVRWSTLKSGEWTDMAVNLKSRSLTPKECTKCAHPCESLHVHVCSAFFFLFHSFFHKSPPFPTPASHVTSGGGI